MGDGTQCLLECDSLRSSWTLKQEKGRKEGA